jgi:type I restriction enzyme S subunit
LVRLGDVVDLTTGFPFASQQYTDDPTAPRLLRGDNVGQGAIRWDGAKRWPAPAAEGLDAYWLREGDVILAMDRPWIEAGLKYAYVRQSDLPALLVQRVARLRGSDCLDTGFLRYVIAGRGFTDYVTGIQTGTAVPHISSGQIQGYRFPLPPLAEQRRITGILGALDDKIDLNRRLSQTLEAMARALFKSWFVDFDPVRAKGAGRDSGLPISLDRLFPASLTESSIGSTPEGWRVSVLNEVLADLETGGRPDGGVAGYSAGVPSIGAESIVGLGRFDYSKTKFVPRSFFDRLLKGRVRDHDVLLYKDGGRPGLFEPHLTLIGDGFPFDECAINEHVYRLRATDEYGQPLLFFWLTSEFAMEEMRVKGTGVAIPGLNSTQLKSLTTLIPPPPVCQAFSVLVDPLVSRILACGSQSRTLAEMRALALPKLVSGERLEACAPAHAHI